MHSIKKQKRIAVIGHLVWDRLNYADGHSIEAFGGTTYNLAALASVAGDDTTIYPVCYIGKDLTAKTAEYWGKYPRLDWSLAKHVKQNQEVHVLYYDNVGYRREDNFNLFPDISKSNFKNCPGIDIALVNYIGGSEFPPESIRWLKGKFNPLIYLDYHSLALSRVSDQQRRFRCHPHWRKYLAEADIVQMNVYELETLFNGVTDIPGKIFDSALEIMDMGPKAAVITRENQDLIAVWRDGRRIMKKAFSVPRVLMAVDSTGCGDSFAGGFVYALSRGKDIEASCLYGLKLAAKKITFSGPDGFFK